MFGKYFMVDFGRVLSGLTWLIMGCLWCITIIGIQLEKCFKLAKLAFCLLEKKLIMVEGITLLNIVWIVLSDLSAVESALIGAMLCLTIIGIPLVAAF